jgi:mannose-6-phosphate isomerase-like protein (cupin superfamily)
MLVMVELEKRSIPQIAARLTQPFSMADVAFVGDILVSVYICHGLLEWHKHTDVDELFWVYEGMILLESELGEVRLRAGELAVVPKGVTHRSGSEARASVLLMRCGVIPERKNGHRRLYATDEEGLKRVRLSLTARAVASPFQFQTVARVEDTALQVAWGEGTWPVAMPAAETLLLFILTGTATVRTSESMLHLHPGDFTVVPEGEVYQLSTTRDATLVRATQEDE